MLHRLFGASLGASLFAMLMTPSAFAETLTFDPQTGTSRTYETAMSITLPDGARTRDRYSEIDGYSRFAVTAQNDRDISLHLSLLRFQMVGEANFAHEDLSGEFANRVSEWRRAGFDMTLDRSSGAISDLHSAAVSEPGVSQPPAAEDFSAIFKVFLRQPALPIAIEVETGWTQTFETLNGARDVTLEVTQVTDDSVYLSYEGGTEGGRIAGLAVVDRQSGWLERQAVTAEIEYPVQGTMMPVRQTVVMAPLIEGRDLYAVTGEWMDQWDDVTSGSTLAPAQNVTESAIFAHSEGGIRSYGDGLTLTLDHDVDNYRGAGRMTFANIRLFDARGQLIDVPTHAGRVFTSPGPRSAEGVQSQVDLMLYGEGDMGAVIDRVVSARAEFSWTPVATEQVDLQLDESGSARLGDEALFIELARGDDPHRYWVEQSDSGIYWTLPKDQVGRLRFYANDRGPDWLRPGESQARLHAASLEPGYLIEMETDQPLTRLPVLIERPQDVPAVTREIQFFREGALEKGDVPGEQALDEPIAMTRSLDELSPTGLDAGQIKLPLDRVQADVCLAELDPGRTVAGRELVFAPLEGVDNATPEGWVLQTEDGRQRYFYDLEPTQAVVRCSGTVQWQPVDIAANSESPTVIEAANFDIELLGLMRVGEFFPHYRLLDEAGQALTLQPADGGGRLTSEDPMSRAISEDGTISVSGEPARIERMVVNDTPVERRLEIEFPALPVDGDS